MLYLNTRKNKKICETAEPRNIWGEDKMCVGAFISVCQQTETIVALYFYFYHVIAFCCCFWHDIMEKHLHLQKSNKQVPWYSPFGPLYSWKYHSKTMVCEVQYPYKRVLCSTAVQKMVLDGNTMEILQLKFMYHGVFGSAWYFHDTCLKYWNCSNLQNYLAYVGTWVGMAPARMNLMLWGECVAVSHHTTVDIVLRNHRFSPTSSNIWPK